MRPLFARPSTVALSLVLVAGSVTAQETAPPEKPAATSDSPSAAESPPAAKNPSAVETGPTDSESKSATPTGTPAPAPAGPGAVAPPVTPPGLPGAVTPPAVPGLPPLPGTPPFPGPPPGLPGVPFPPPVPGGVAVPGAAPAPGSPPPAGHPAVFRYYDKNGDQVLSPEELEKVPAPIREWIAREKLDVTEGLKRELFDTSAPKLVDHLRARTAETILAPAPLPVPGSQPAPSSGGRNDRSRGGSSEFRALDLDQDAQLSFREWRAGKRLAADFAPRDLNGDGMVTSAEFDQTKDLASSGTVASATGTSGTATSRPTGPAGTTPPIVPGGPGSPSVPGRPPFTPPTPPGPFGAPPAPPALPASASSGNTLGTVASRQTFETLDRNKDGMINPDEWGNSRRVGPGFKEKGIDISKDMSQADFHANYAKAFPPR